MRELGLVLAVIVVGLAGCKESTPAGPNTGEVELAERVQLAIAGQAPELNVILVDAYTLKLKGKNDVEATLSLDNLRVACGADPDGCQAAVGNYARVAVSTVRSVRAQTKPSREQVRVQLKPASYLAEVEQAVAEGPADRQADNTVVHRPFVADLHAFYVVNRPGSIALLNKGTQRELGILDADLYSLALVNLYRALGTIPIEPLEGIDGLYVVEVGDSYEAARLVLHEAWKPVADKLPGDLIVCAPSRDTVLVAGSDSTEALMTMEKMARAMVEAEAYALSATMLRWTPERWIVYLPDEARSR
jgi:hypothetical protein